MKHRGSAILALTLAAVFLLSGSALAAGPARLQESDAIIYDDAETLSADDGPSFVYENYDTVYVETVDELLAAIAPYRTIVLAPGTYDLSQASDYGRYNYSDGIYYRWEEVYDGYELVIESVDHLAIVFDGAPTDAVLSTAPRYADVLSLRNCRDVSLSGFTAGHTEAPGECSGGVIDLMNDANVNIMDCRLYGCGILGIYAEYCRTLYVTGTSIYDCSDGAARLYACYDIRMVACEFTFCGGYDYSGEGYSWPASSMFYVYDCCGVAILDGLIYGNYVGSILISDLSREVYMMDMTVSGNSCPAEWGPEILFTSYGEPIIVAGCEFWDEADPWPADSPCVVDLNGQPITSEALFAMRQEFIFYEGPRPLVEPDWQMDNFGGRWAEVSTVDELLAAIGPDVTVYLAPGEYDLTTAENYGAYGGSYYYWEDRYDGPGLVIEGVENFRLVGDAKENTILLTGPRYADVLSFRNCSDVFLSFLTAGHIQEAGECVGAVLGYDGCYNISVYGCGLFGCGTLGIDAIRTELISVMETEIYQCSLGAVSLMDCYDAAFYGNDIHDCAFPTYTFWDCEEIYLDGELTDEVLIDLAEAGPYRASQSSAPWAVG